MALASSTACLPPPASAAAAAGGRGSGVAVAPHAHGLQRCSSSISGPPLQQQRGPRQQRRAAAAAAGRPVAVAAPSALLTTPADRFGQDDWDAFLSGYRSCYHERSYWIDDSMIEGTIPPELEGTLLRNGPGLFEVGGKKIPQPFDGDGLLAIFAFKGGRAFFANRYIRTEGFVKEQQAQRLLYRGAFSVGNPTGGLFYNPFDLSVKGIANTGVVRWGGKLLALYERDLPYEVSAPALRTLGQTVGVPSEAPYFGAHYRVTQAADGSRRLVAFNAAERGADSRINVFEYDEQMRLLHRTEVDLPNAAFGFFHDFLATPTHYIFLESPMSLDLWKMATEYMLGKACIAECIKWDAPNRQTKIHLIPRPGTGGSQGEAGRREFVAPQPFFSFHHANAFETADGKVMLDTVANLDGVDFSANFETGPAYYDDNVGRGTLTRLVIDTKTGAVSQHRLMDRACEFPCVAPAVVGRPHTHMYMVGSRFPGADAWGAPQAVVKASLAPEAGASQPCSTAAVATDVYFPGRRAFAQEPIFVPRPGGTAEDDGWVMTLVYDAEEQRTRLAILDARNLAAGPVASIRLPHALPFGLHGSWTSDYLGPALGQEWAPTEYDIRQGVTKDTA